jgi:hypothetical protein
MRYLAETTRDRKESLWLDVVSAEGDTSTEAARAVFVKITGKKFKKREGLHLERVQPGTTYWVYPATSSRNGTVLGDRWIFHINPIEENA